MYIYSCEYQHTRDQGFRLYRFITDMFIRTFKRQHSWYKLLDFDNDALFNRALDVQIPSELSFDLNLTCHFVCLDTGDVLDGGGEWAPLYDHRPLPCFLALNLA